MAELVGPLRVTLLGTGASAGVPTIGGPDGRGDWGACDPAELRNRRTRAAIAIAGGAGVLLVDTPPELRIQLIAAGLARADALLYTHAHADHVTGLDDVRLINRAIDRPLDTYATPTTLDEIRQRFPYAFLPWKPPGFFRPVLVPHPVAPGETHAMAGLPTTLIDQDHGFIRSLGLRIGGFGYSTDVVDMDEPALQALAGIETWVVGCYQREPHRTHAWLDRVLGWVARLTPRRTLLTHMGTDMDWAWLHRNLPSGVEPAHDGQVLDIPA